ncbi:hypothetical protein BU16DRAFT_531799 [Lophium mytilinum]|uniref:Uncharacterized protein n=1 Tax=Lophium mytilinum TaxID=390894 RepID=A0A6A6QDJ4_9PEZI|nr:hypothetical protein BU16DRAFT_531799 [Lophium mytilinum]
MSLPQHPLCFEPNSTYGNISSGDVPDNQNDTPTTSSADYSWDDSDHRQIRSPQPSRPIKTLSKVSEATGALQPLDVITGKSDGTKRTRQRSHSSTSAHKRPRMQEDELWSLYTEIRPGPGPALTSQHITMQEWSALHDRTAAGIHSVERNMRLMIVHRQKLSTSTAHYIYKAVGSLRLELELGFLQLAVRDWAWDYLETAFEDICSYFLYSAAASLEGRNVDRNSLLVDAIEELTAGMELALQESTWEETEELYEEQTEQEAGEETEDDSEE